MTGVSAQRAMRLLNTVAKDMMGGKRLTPGQKIAVRSGPLVEIVEVANPDAHMEWAVAFGGPGGKGAAAGVGRRPRPLAVGGRVQRRQGQAAGARRRALRTRSGGTAPCSAASTTATSPWPSPDTASDTSAKVA